MQIIKQHQNYHYYFSVEFQAGHQYLGNILKKKNALTIFTSIQIQNIILEINDLTNKNSSKDDCLVKVRHEKY